MLEVIEPGLLSTIQDRGRPDQGHLGVARAGAADDLALAVANLLLGNAGHEPALEMTLLGASFAVRADVLVGLSGADMEAHVPEEGRALATAMSHRLHAGTTLVLGGALDGARTYLALPGGIVAQHALGSASTDPVAGFGGIEGRSLKPGDIIEPAASPDRVSRERVWPSGVPAAGVVPGDGPRFAEVVVGPHLDVMAAAVRDSLVQPAWTVTPRSDRVGLRLEGPAIADLGAAALVSMPMLPGAIQLPPNGLPIVLMADAPTIGGYPVPAVVCQVDLAVMGQLRPGDRVRFSWIDVDAARRRARDRALRLGIAGDSIRQR